MSAVIPVRTADFRSGWRDGLRRSVMVVLAVAGLAACTTGFIYNRLEWLAVWYVNGLVSLDDNQEQQVRELVRTSREWHRTRQLPHYVAFLDGLDRDTDAAMTPQMVEARYQEMVALWDEFLIHLTPEVTPLLQSLTADQVTELFNNLEEDNQELREEYAGSTTELRQKRRAKATLRGLQRFTGRLSGEQRDLISRRLAGMHDVAVEWLERRRAWQDRFRELLEHSASGAGFEDDLRDLLLNPNQFDTADYRRKVSENLQTVFVMLADLSARLTDSQRDRMGKKLQGYATDLEKLTRED